MGRFSHEKIIKKIRKRPELLAIAMELPNLWIRGAELSLGWGNDPYEERVDLDFQNQFDSWKILPKTTAYVVELKKGQADHEVIGQIQKAIESRIAKMVGTNHWHNVEGVLIAESYTDTTLKMLKTNNHHILYYEEYGRKMKLYKKDWSPKKWDGITRLPKIF